MALAFETLDNTGILRVSGILDDQAGSSISSNAAFYGAGELDEVTISPMTDGLAKRIHGNGLIQVANYFDEIGIVQRGLTLQLDSEESDSYANTGSTWYDIAPGAANNVTLYNSPTFTNSAPRYFTFNGSNQYGTSSGRVLGANNYSKQVWFYLNGYADNNLLSSDSGHFLYFGTSTNRVYSGHVEFTNFMANGSTATFNLNTWYNVAVTFDVAVGFTLYVNGVQDSTYSWTTALSGNGSTNVACFSANGNLLNGRIAQALAYNVTLSADEVKHNYDQTKSRFGF